MILNVCKINISFNICNSFYCVGPADSFRDVTKFLLKSSVGCLLGIKKKMAASFRLDMLNSLKADLLLSHYQFINVFFSWLS